MLETQRELTSERQLIDALIAQLPVALIAVRAPTQEIFLTNNRMTDVFQQRGAGPSSFNRCRAFGPDGKEYEKLDWPVYRALNGEIVTDEEILCILPDESRLTISMSAAAFKDSENNIVGAVAVGDDVTLQRKLENDKVALLGREQGLIDALDLKSTFVANLSHEIRTPLVLTCISLDLTFRMESLVWQTCCWILFQQRNSWE